MIPVVDWSAKFVSRSSWYASTLPVTTAAPTSVAPSISSTAMWTGFRPATTSTAADAHHDHEHRAEVVLGVHDRHHRAREPERDREPPRVEIAPVLVAVARDRDDQRDLGDLGRLELERPDLEPRLGTLVVAADDEHGEEQRQDGEVRRAPTGRGCAGSRSP